MKEHETRNFKLAKARIQWEKFSILIKQGLSYNSKRKDLTRKIQFFSFSNFSGLILS